MGYLSSYPNKYLKEVGSERARHDVRECQIEAEDYAGRSRGQGARSVARKAAGGAAVGALGATIMGSNAGRGAGAGAAIAGVRGLAGNVKENREGSPEFRSFVEACLENKGYKVVGWKG